MEESQLMGLRILRVKQEKKGGGTENTDRILQCEV